MNALIYLYISYSAFLLYVYIYVVTFTDMLYVYMRKLYMNV